MKTLDIIIWIISVSGIVAVIANIYKKAWCFIIWAFMNAFFVGLNVSLGKRFYPLAGLYFIQFILAIHGYRKWTK